MRKKFYLILMLISLFGYAQVGINTTNPQGVFNIDAGKDNPESGVPTAIQSLNDLVFDNLGNLGLGTVLPIRKLHVNANNQPIRFENLQSLPANTNTNSLVIDDNGDIYKNNTVSVEGQILRIGINNSTYIAGIEAALRFNSHDSFGEMGTAPNSAPNFINTIIGATITDAVSATAGQGSPARTTDRITLPPGIYKIQVRLIVTVPAGGSAATFIKCIVNNNEYSLINSASGSSSASAHYYDDYINITGGAQTVDFTILPVSSNLTVSSSASPGGVGNSYRSLIMIQRLR